MVRVSVLPYLLLLGTFGLSFLNERPPNGGQKSFLLGTLECCAGHRIVRNCLIRNASPFSDTRDSRALLQTEGTLCSFVYARRSHILVWDFRYWKCDRCCVVRELPQF